MIAATFASALLAACTVKIPAVATGIIPSAPVEFLLVAPDSDRDYESVFIAESKRERMSFRRKRRFIVNDDAHVRFFLQSAHQKNASRSCSEIDGAESAVTA